MKKRSSEGEMRDFRCGGGDIDDDDEGGGGDEDGNSRGILDGALEDSGMEEDEEDEGTTGVGT
jgi:hypothetical protein